MSTLSDIYIAKLYAAIEDLRTLLTNLPHDQATPILARLAEMERMLTQNEKR